MSTLRVNLSLITPIKGYSVTKKNTKNLRYIELVLVPLTFFSPIKPGHFLESLSPFINT